MPAGKRSARIELTSSAAGMDKGLRDARRKMRTFQRDSERSSKRAAKEYDQRVSRTTKATIGLGRSVAAGMAAAAGMDVAGGIGGMVKDVFDVEKEMTRFQIDAQLSSAQMAKFRDSIMATSQATGVSRLELVKGAHAYQILTGDAEGAVQATELFAKVANASGASMEDIAATAASMRKNLGFDPRDFQKGFDVLLSMGHKGSVELRDFAEELSGIAPQFKDFGQGSSADKLAEMAASAQIIRLNFADASEMATGFRSLMTAITKKYDKLADYGVQVFRVDPKTKKLVKRDFLDIVGDIIKNPQLNDKVLPKLLGRQEAVRALGAMRDHWQEIIDLQHQSADSNQVERDNATYMASSTGRIARAWESIKNAVASALTPERIAAFADVLERAVALAGDLIRTLDAVAKWIDEHSPKSAQETADDLTKGMTDAQREAFAKDQDARAAIMGGVHHSGAGIAAGILGFGSMPDEVQQQIGESALNFAGGGNADNDFVTGKYFGDTAARARGGGVSAVDEVRLAAAIVEGMRKANIVIRANENDIAKAGRSAQIQSTRPGGRR